MCIRTLQICVIKEPYYLHSWQCQRFSLDNNSIIPNRGSCPILIVNVYIQCVHELSMCMCMYVDVISIRAIGVSRISAFIENKYMTPVTPLITKSRERNRALSARDLSPSFLPIPPPPILPIVITVDDDAIAWKVSLHSRCFFFHVNDVTCRRETDAAMPVAERYGGKREGKEYHLGVYTSPLNSDERRERARRNSFPSSYGYFRQTTHRDVSSSTFIRPWHARAGASCVICNWTFYR